MESGVLVSDCLALLLWTCEEQPRQSRQSTEVCESHDSPAAGRKSTSTELGRPRLVVSGPSGQGWPRSFSGQWLAMNRTGEYEQQQGRGT